MPVCVNCDPDLVARLDKFTVSMKRAQVAKRALQLGLAMIERDPALLISAPPERRMRTKAAQ